MKIKKIKKILKSLSRKEKKRIIKILKTDIKKVKVLTKNKNGFKIKKSKKMPACKDIGFGYSSCGGGVRYSSC